MNQYQEIVEDLKHCHWEDYSDLKFNLIKRDLKKTLKKAGRIDYNLFPPTFRWHLCSSRLTQGKFSNWDGFEFRSDWSITFQGLNGFSLPVPKWTGGKVKKLVIAAEQGVGDEILYASAIPELIVRLGHEPLELQCHPRLIPVFERSFRISCVPRVNLSRIEGDAVVALADLFVFYRRDKSHFPKKPYLKTDSIRVDYWKETLEKLPGKKIGIAWKSRHGSIDPKRLMTEEATYINLQYGAKTEGTLDIAPDPLEDMDDHLNFIKALDQVISVTQTVIHEAGSVGTPCIAIKPHKGTGDVDCGLWYYGMGCSPHEHHIYGSVEVYESIEDYESTKRHPA
jgi:hypothetical protein